MERFRWIAISLVGIGLIIGGVVQITDDSVSCGSQEMTSDSQVCETTTEGGSTETRSLSEQRDENKQNGFIMLGIGVLMLCGGAYFAFDAARKKKAAAEAAAMAGPPPMQAMQGAGMPPAGQPYGQPPAGPPAPQAQPANFGPAPGQGYPQQPPPPQWGPPPGAPQGPPPQQGQPQCGPPPGPPHAQQPPQWGPPPR